MRRPRTRLGPSTDPIVHKCIGTEKIEESKKRKRYFIPPRYAGGRKEFQLNLRVGSASNNYPCKAAYILALAYKAICWRRGRARKRRPKQTRGRLLFNHGLGSRVHTRTHEADLVEGGVVTEKRRTPKDTREHHTQYNRQTTALHSHRPLASGCRRGMQLHSNVV